MKYCGEAGRNCFSRGVEHLGGYRRQEKGNVLWKHAVDKHGGRLDEPDEENRRVIKN